MSGFIAGAPVPASHINSDPYWPSVDLETVRAALRIDASVTEARLETAVVAAMIEVNRGLAEWRAAQQAQGYASLDQVPAEPINGISGLVHLYLRAVQAGAGAEIIERYRGYDTTNSGERNAEAIQDLRDEYRRDQRWALSDLVGRRRMTVELI
ncbi:head completion/stabilization protein [Pseudomonas sp. RIT-PI-AD]|uniref:head completion/stabilization protein n=1 Tax=Pseudomonas sp. RIT-PI-AD TaxID=3035294 RepID=UPI0021D88D16|nr:head completion/stabilization protein [Pseudomonas sp. RIT-PI-AD]